jgi:transcriptional regulator GlxA family with amidase domain
LWRTRCAEDAVAVLARALVQRRASFCAPAAAATAALDVVRRSDGALPCERIAHRVGISLRHLRRQVHDATGLSPKKYARTLRLIKSMRLADGSARPSWADVAIAAGYCDQSHLIRECVAATGSTPRELHAERRRQIVGMAELSNPG